MKKLLSVVAVICLAIILSVSVFGCFSSQPQERVVVISERLAYASSSLNYIKLFVEIENTSSSEVTVYFKANLLIDDGKSVYDTASSNNITLLPGNRGTIYCIFDASPWLYIDSYSYQILEWYYI